MKMLKQMMILLIFLFITFTSYTVSSEIKALPSTLTSPFLETRILLLKIKNLILLMVCGNGK